MHKLIITAASTLFFASAAFAVEQPTPEEVKKVMNYYENGKGGGPILLDFQLCKKIGRPEKGKKKACLDTIEGAVAKGTVINAFSRWLVPKGDKYDDLRVQFIHEGEMRAVKDVKVSTSTSYGTWKGKTLNKTGKWEIKLMRGKAQLASATVDVE